MRRGIAELNIEKQRNGPTGRVKLHFEARYARFDDLAESEGDSGAPSSGGFAAADGGFGDETPF